MMKTLKILPSDLGFLYEDCPKCFYRKVVHGINLPSKPMATIFEKIHDLEQKEFFNKVLSDLDVNLPNGKLKQIEMPVMSNYTECSGGEFQWYISGRLDGLLEMENLVFI